VLNFLKAQKIDIHALIAKMSFEDAKEMLVVIFQECAKQNKAKPKSVELQRDLAPIPLRGIDVPLYFTFWRC